MDTQAPRFQISKGERSKFFFGLTFSDGFCLAADPSNKQKGDKMLRRSFSMLVTLILLLAVFTPTLKVQAASCSYSLLAPWRVSSTQVRARVTLTCTTTQSQLHPTALLSRDGANWDWWNAPFCNNTTTCTATVTATCVTGYWYSAGTAQVNGLTVPPSAKYSAATWITC